MLHMVRRLPLLTPNAKVRYLRVSLPLVPCLLDGQKYFRPDDPLPPASSEELWRPDIRASATGLSPELPIGAD